MTSKIVNQACDMDDCNCDSVSLDEALKKSLEMETGELIPTKCPDPDPINPLQSMGFVLKFTKLPSVSYWCKNASVPTVTTNEVTQENRFTPIFRPGTRPTFDALNVTFTVDEKMNNYADAYEWLKLISLYEDSGNLTTWKQKWADLFKCDIKKDIDFPDLCSDATLTIIGANNKPVRTFTFRDCFITSLGSMQFTEETSETVYVTCDATFRYVGGFVLSDCLL